MKPAGIPARPKGGLPIPRLTSLERYARAHPTFLSVRFDSDGRVRWNGRAAATWMPVRCGVIVANRSEASRHPSMRAALFYAVTGSEGE